MSAERIELLVIVIAAVAILARRIRLPYTVGLLAAGIGLGIMPGNDHLRLTRELIFSFLLPPLIYEASINLRWDKLKAELPILIAYATVGLGLAAAVVAFGMHAVLGWPIAASVVFAVLISATDPVSVIAAFKDSGQTGRIRLLVEAESLLNDGTAAVAFGIALALSAGGHVSPSEAGLQFFVTAGGGILAGALTAGAGLLVAGKTDDYLVEVVVTLAMAYGSFLFAEHFHWSGVLACLTSGLVAGVYGAKGLFSDKGRESMELFWEFAAFAANSVVFLLIGVRASRVSVGNSIIPISVAIVLVLLGRLVTVYSIGTAFRWSRWKVGGAAQHLLFWGGLRGALALALVLGIPESMSGYAEVTVVTLGVVVFSVVVQGLTIRPFITRAMAEPQG